MSEEYHSLEKKPMGQWTDKDLSDYSKNIAVRIENATEGNDFLSELLLDLLVLTRIITLSQRVDALKREQTLRQDLRAAMEEVAENHVEFQFEEFDRRNKEVINHIQNRIESLNISLERFEDQ